MGERLRPPQAGRPLATAARPEPLLRHIRRLVSRPAADPDRDAALLARFARDRDVFAFAALVARHGRRVLGVCRRVLRDAHEAEDAAQATWLVLARKAAAIRRPRALAAWLHGVTHHLALKARRSDERRREREAQLALGVSRPADPLDEVSARELLVILEEELQRLPEAYRLPILLCCLEGRTAQEAAGRLGWTPGPVRARLVRGRKRLHARLVRRGLTLGAALAAVEAERAVGGASAGALGVRAAATVRAALAFAAKPGEAATGAAASAKVAALAEGVLEGMAMTKLKGRAGAAGPRGGGGGAPGAGGEATGRQTKGRTAAVGGGG